MSINVGTLSTVRPGDLSELRGTVRTVGLALDIVVRGDPKRADDRKPSHRVYVRDGKGEVEVGPAWLKTIKRGENAGRHMVNLEIDFPGMVAPLQASAYPDDSGDAFGLVWQRQRQTKPTSEAA